MSIYVVNIQIDRKSKPIEMGIFNSGRGEVDVRENRSRSGSGAAGGIPAMHIGFGCLRDEL